MLIYQCPHLTGEVITGKDCESSPTIVQQCRGINVLAGWAIGGDVSVYNACYDGASYVTVYCIGVI